MRNIAAVILTATISLALCALLPKTAFAGYYTNLNAWRYQRFYTLRTGIGLTYEKIWDDRREDQSLTQSYGASLNGPIFDPRLVTFDLDLGVVRMDSTVTSKEYETKRLNLQVSIFNKINRERGLKLWKYLPMPITFVYSHIDSKYLISDSYSVSMYYSRPGKIRLFSNEGFISYDDGKKKQNGNANAYSNRLKKTYRQNNEESNRNWNRNGNGNWSRNGNGNWNRNGNGNWNRNGNGNWNRNGNGNWNRNGNGNWNRNGNGNWNRNGNGNWNRNGNGNWNRNGNGNWNSNGGNNSNWNTGNANWNTAFIRGQEEREPWGFKFPNLSFAYNKYIWSRKGKSASYERNSLLFTVASSTGSRTPRNEGSRSNYNFRYIKSEDSYRNLDKTSYLLDAWRSSNGLLWNGSFARLEVNEDKTTKGATGVSYQNEFSKLLQYRAFTRVGYADYSGSRTETYSMGYSLYSRAQKEITLAPKITSLSRASASYSMQKDKDREANDVYSLNLTETIRVKRISRTKLYVIGGLNFSEGSASLRHTMGAQYSFVRIGEMEFVHQYSKRLNEDGYSHRFQLEGRFNIRNNLHASARAGHSITSNGVTEKRSTSLAGTATWLIRRGNTLRGKLTALYNKDVNRYSAAIESINKLSSRSGLNLRAVWLWNNINPGTSKQYSVNFGTSYKGVKFTAGYSRVEDFNGNVQQRLLVNARKTFQTKLRRLF